MAALFQTVSSTERFTGARPAVQGVRISRTGCHPTAARHVPRNNGSVFLSRRGRSIITPSHYHTDAEIQAELQNGPFPKLVVFDLDATMWLPEMFQLRAVPDEVLPDGGLRAGDQVVQMFPGALAALRQLHSDPRFKDTKIAVASASEQPFFADACLRLFEVVPGVSFGSMISWKEIYPISNKAFHFNKIKKLSGLEFSDMLFFDDNIWGDKTGEVARQCVGVTTMTVPDGLTVQKWEAGLLAFARAAKARTASGR